MDDVEFLLDEGASVIHVRSASRLGRKDFGVNRARIEAIRARLQSELNKPKGIDTMSYTTTPSGLQFNDTVVGSGEEARAGDRVSADNVRSIRPAGGLAPDAFSLVEGRTFVADTPKGTALSWDLI